MTYFSRRNEYLVEYSGHEEASLNLRTRLATILDGVVNGRHTTYRNLLWANIFMEFPRKLSYRDFRSLLDERISSFDEVFSIIEIFLESIGILAEGRSPEIQKIKEAFELSGSVYEINRNRVQLKIDKDLAEKVDSLKTILAPHQEFQSRFFQAVGNLVGRRAKAEDIVKDIFVGVEGYLKVITNTSRFGDAIKDLAKKNFINKEQKKVLEALHEFRSDADGAGHAGNSVTPTEETALWFLDTIVAQVRMIDKATKK